MSYKSKPLFRLDDPEYKSQRQEMVEELVNYHLNKNQEEIFLHYKEFLFHEFHGLDDDSLQTVHDDIFLVDKNESKV